MSKPLLISIVGQTATGKTDFALKLAEQLLASGHKKIILLSADSKQVYQNLTILTGADIPAGFQVTKQDRAPYPFFQNADRSIELHGLACVFGDEEWSVAHFHKLFKVLMQNVTPKTALIIVGGTGLYHQQIFAPAATTTIKPNPQLRKKLDQYSLIKLQETLRKTWPDRWQAMNHSDRQNPRRLIRAIEVTQAGARPKASPNQEPIIQFGLQLPLKILQVKIAERVEQRIEQGVMAEVQQFEMHHPALNLQAKDALGYQEIIQYLQGKLGLEELKAAWILAETQYAKRQQTWWKKQSNIHWLTNQTITKSVQLLLKHHGK